MADQVVNDGAILTTEHGTQLVLTGVRYQEDADGNRFNHEYIFRSVDEIQAEKEAEEKAAEEARVAQEEAERAEAERNEQLQREGGVQ